MCPGPSAPHHRWVTTAADTDRVAPVPTPEWAPWVEVLSSMAACGLVVALMFNWLSVNLTFFGVEAVADPADVRHYWIIVALLAVSVVGSFVAAFHRGAGAALIWHVVVAIVA